ncbi:hypothetical protein C5B42_03500 [Candidatus Cerribacteria bacterium 'Amazon FNV 2010 28 9']|uniref:Uncharacterized protein n=1 Tax=Candidatus Cerribacteria bacterium 'Amazon FNV 2010 28 9' TaxID=2081795 RepID=A0A317JNX7_9BACT|nr:MAG: hypothetical protein C5B42_03500 [Candidatus Cerribacteria bacterium 'Amazon FNV 2010 28 9']
MKFVVNWGGIVRLLLVGIVVGLVGSVVALGVMQYWSIGPIVLPSLVTFGAISLLLYLREPAVLQPFTVWTLMLGTGLAVGLLPQALGINGLIASLVVIVWLSATDAYVVVGRIVRPPSK